MSAGGAAAAAALLEEASRPLARAARRVREQMTRERSRRLAAERENHGRVRKSASGTAKYTLHQRCIAHELGFGRDRLALAFMHAFWESEWPREWEVAYRQLVKLRYDLVGRVDEDEMSIWSMLFKDPGSLGIGYQHVRTCFFDDVVEDHADTYQQLVILGAGFDSRCYRLANRPSRCFEVDAPTTQAEKRAVLGKCGVDSDHVSFVPVDFSVQDWKEELKKRGFDSALPTIFLIEGVLYYLTDDVIRRMFQLIADCSDVLVAYDVYYSWFSLDSRTVELMKRGYGEPFMSGVELGMEGAAATEVGLRVIETVSAEEANRRYVPRKADGDLVCPAFRGIALVVASSSSATTRGVMLSTTQKQPMPGSTAVASPAKAEVLAEVLSNDCKFASALLHQANDNRHRSSNLSLDNTLDMIESLLGKPVDGDASLMDAGLDSIMTVELIQMLQSALGTAAKLPVTLVFEEPTARGLFTSIQQSLWIVTSGTVAVDSGVKERALPLQGSSESHAKHVDQVHCNDAISQGRDGPGCGGIPASGPLAYPFRARDVTRDITISLEQHSMKTRSSAGIIGTSCLFPGGVAHRSQLLAAVSCASNMVDEVPHERWTVADLGEAPNDITYRQRHGGFFRGLHLFDSSSFSISAIEAFAMDPQHRLLLEGGYAALRAAGHSRKSLLGNLMGVFIGIQSADFMSVLQSSPASDSAYAVTGAFRAIASGRLSYVFGMQGPAVAYDTACSAQHVACHGGLRMTQLSECQGALVCGMNMMLTPQVSRQMAIAGMTSPCGRSFTWDVRADGYARAEGGASFVLGVNEGLHCLQLSGLAVLQDGKSASLTAPNGKAQRAVVLHALSDSGALSIQRLAVEAHGTGTALGDPVEFASLTAAMTKEGITNLQSLAIGSVKANVGHGEPSAGGQGLLTLAALMYTQRCIPNAQLRQKNLHLSTPIQSNVHVLLAQLGRCNWTTGGVSSFGYSGTIAHAVLQSAATARNVDAPMPSLIYRRRAFRWRPATQPFTQLLLPSLLGSGGICRSPLSGVLLTLITDHVIHGRIVFPGSASLEMARATSSALSASEETRAALHEVLFLQMLVVEASDRHVECEVMGRRFELRSGRCFAGQSSMEHAVVHCAGELASDDGRGWHRGAIGVFRSGGCAAATSIAALYSRFHEAGLQYGPCYRTLSRAWGGASSGASRLQMRWVHENASVHPAQLDDALCSGALMESARGCKETRLPFAVRMAWLDSESSELWAVRGRPATSAAPLHTTIGVRSVGACLHPFLFAAPLQVVRRQDGDAMSVWLGPSNGSPQAQLDGFLSRLLRGVESVRRDTYVTCWRVSSAAKMVGGASVVVGDCRRTAGCLQSDQSFVRLRDAHCVLATALQWGSMRPEALSALEAALCLVQAQVSVAGPPSLRLLTTGSVSIHQGLWGVARSARAETSVPLQCVGALLVAEAAQAPAPREVEAIMHLREILVPRLMRAPASIAGVVRLRLVARGAMSGLELEAQPTMSRVREAEVLVRVCAVGLNFRDVLNVLGEYPGDPGPPGADTAGLVVERDARSTHEAGSAVFGVGYAPLACIARAASEVLVAKPTWFSFEQACTLPIAWSTAHMAAAGSCARLLTIIQAAAGGVGLKASELAHWIGSGVMGTAGRPHKHVALRALGVGGSCTSRGGGGFAVGAMRQLESRRAQKILNSLSADILVASFALTCEHGCLAEIGKRGAWSSERQVRSAAQTSGYQVLAIDTTIAGEPEWVQACLRLLSHRARERVATALPAHGFDMESQYVAAFRMVQRGSHVGKVVLRVAWHEAHCAGRQLVTGGKVVLRVAWHEAHCAGRQLVTGGTGGLGLLTGRWLVQMGSRELILASRRGGFGRGEMPEWQAELASVGAWLAQCDAGEIAQTRQLVALARSLRGVWHAAGVLADSLLNQQRASSLAGVHACKAWGASLLGSLSTAMRVQAFVLFSSVAALLGSSGQANYAAANACLDSLSSCRRACGTVGASVQWGAWAEVGMATRGAARERMAAMEARGLGRLEVARGLATLAVTVCQAAPSVVAAMRVTWSLFDGNGAASPALLSAFALGESRSGPVRLKRLLKPAMAHAAPLDLVLGMVKLVSGGAVDADAPLLESGIDSLGAVELRNRLQAMTGVDASLPHMLVFDHPTSRQLTKAIQSETLSFDCIGAVACSVLVAEQPRLKPNSVWPSLSSATSMPCAPKVLMLHGRAGNAELFELQMRSKGWLDSTKTNVDFLFLDGTKQCEPLPDLWPGFQGFYSTSTTYYEWGLDDRQQTAASVQHVLSYIRDHQPVHGIGGFCDGAILAALVALEDVSLQFYINFCGGPISRACDYLSDLTLRSIKAPCLALRSLHCLGTRDEVFSWEQLCGILSICKAASVIAHTEGHVVPWYSREAAAALREILKATGANAFGPD